MNPRVGASLVVTLIVSAVGVAWMFSGAKGTKGDGVPTYAAKQGPLTISVTEAGTIRAREQVIIKSQVEGMVNILYLIPEGQKVKKGDLLVELDATQLKTDRVSQEIRVQNTNAAYIRSREQIEVTKSQGQSDIAKAKLARDFAIEDLKNYKQGEYPNEQKTAESKIALAEQELGRAEERLKWSKVLFEEKYISESDLKADEASEKKARLDLDLAKANKNLLETFTHKRRLAELAADVDQTGSALERVKRKAAADDVQAAADLKAKQAEYERQKSNLEKIGRQIGLTKIYAPTEGEVIYATTGKGSWRGNQEPLAQGQAIRFRGELIHLPTASLMMADVKIHESSLKKVEVGLPVRLSIDALPGAVFDGRVTKISPLPDAQSMWLNPDLKVYGAEVEIDGVAESLRTGMSCRAEILVKELEDVVYIPLQSVFRGKEGPSVLVRSGSTDRVRQVELGMDNNSLVHIEKGLEAGEAVVLSPPLELGARDVVGKALPGNPDRKPDKKEIGRKSPSPEQREAWRKKLESMSAEERAEFRKKMQKRRRENGGA